MNTQWLVCFSAALAMALASRADADPIKLVPIAVTASNTYAGSSHGNVVDGDGATIWNAGDFATQWIQLDLGRTYSLRTIRMQLAQSPAGQTTHIISVGQDPSNLTSLPPFTGNTVSGDWLTYDLGGQELGNVRYVRITTTASPSWVAWAEIEIYGGVEYLGYFADAFNQDYIPETTANGANLVWVTNTGADYAADYATKLAEASQRGAKAMLFVGYQLFDTSTPFHWVLRPDWEAQWSRIVDIIRAAPPNAVAAFYIADEPYGYGITAATLTAINARIKQDFPTIPIAVILTHWDVLANLGPQAVAMFDWVGFDCYDKGGGSWDNCDGLGHSISTMIPTLRSWLTSSQRMMAVPRAFRWGGTSTGSTALDQDQVLQVINRWQQEVLSDGKYVAVMPFLWQSIDLDQDGLTDPGARDLPWVKERLYQFAHTLFVAGDDHAFVSDWDASGMYGEYRPFAAFDRDTSGASGWVSGGFATQYIEARFPGVTRIGRIQLWVAQLPSGAATNIIKGRLADGSWITIGTLQATQDGQLLTWVPRIFGLTYDLDRVQIVTTQSPSWVAWHDIQFFTH